jgi:excisionase family DNA binding protein
MGFSESFISFLQAVKLMKLLTAKEAAKYLRISLFTLARMEKEGLLMPFRTPGGHRRYSVEMLNEYLESSRGRIPAGGSRILVVDDGEDIVHLLAHVFPSCQFSAASDTLRVGIELAEFKPDLILVNTAMSGLDGLELCRRLGGHGHEADVLPFHAASARQEDNKEAGFDVSNVVSLKERIKHLLQG